MRRPSSISFHILLDLRLPRIDGLEQFIKVVRSIKELWLTIKLPPNEVK